MVKVICGNKGTGKTKMLIETANALSSNNKGDVVFVDDTNQLMYDLKQKIRFVNISDFPITGWSSFLGFLCGIIAQDYDVDSIFIDRMNHIVKEDIFLAGAFMELLNELSSKFNVDFYLSISGDKAVMPEFISKLA